MQYLTINADVARLNKRKTELRNQMLEIVETDHVEDEEKGHLNHALPEPVTVDGKTYRGFQKQRKVSQTFNEDRALELLHAKASAEGAEITEEDFMTPVLDQDKVARLYAQDHLTDEEFDSLFEENVTYSFVAMKE